MGGLGTGLVSIRTILAKEILQMEICAIKETPNLPRSADW